MVNYRPQCATCVPAEKGIQQMNIYCRSVSEKSGTQLQQVKAAGGKCVASMECHPQLTRENKEGKNIYIKSQSVWKNFCMQKLGVYYT